MCNSSKKKGYVQDRRILKIVLEDGLYSTLNDKGKFFVQNGTE